LFPTLFLFYSVEWLGDIRQKGVEVWKEKGEEKENQVGTARKFSEKGRERKEKEEREREGGDKMHY